jgi:hypothetical protein
MSKVIATEPFRFYTSSLLVAITGKKAHHLKEFVQVLKEIDPSSIFYHVHNAFREYSFAPGRYSNDFARWVAEDVEESTLAEKLSSIYVADYTNIEEIRQRLIEIIENYLMTATEIRKAPPGREFHFLRSIAIVSPTEYEARTLPEFVVALKRVGMRSLYFHFFEAHLRLGRKTNDFSNWIRFSLDNPEVANEIEALDPYFMTLDKMRDRIIEICQGSAESKLVKVLVRVPQEIAHDTVTFSKRIFRRLFKWLYE